MYIIYANFEIVGNVIVNIYNTKKMRRSQAYEQYINNMGLVPKRWLTIQRIYCI